MDIDSAKAFETRLEAAVAELSKALLIAQTGCSADQFEGVTRSIGHLIAGVDRLLREAIYAEHPELDRLRKKS